MLHLARKAPEKPKRVVILGGGGFVGGALARLLAEKKVPLLPVTRAEADFRQPAATEYLARTVQEGDVVVNAAAVAPCKDLDQLGINLIIIQNIQAGLAGKKLAQIVNISSDAVFGDQESPITECTPPSPGSYHGVMHLMREITINQHADVPVAHVRPTLIYGSADPHNGYGPNRFARQALAGEAIPLFGQGEERRDHIFIDDLVEIVWRVIAHQATGELTAATGEVHSFHALAELVINLTRSSSTLQYLPRSGPMPHNGYRPFDVGAIARAFPDFQFTPIETGLARTIEGLRAAQPWKAAC